MAKEKKVPLNLYITISLREKLNEKNINISALVEGLLRDYLELSEKVIQ